jgi:hypothetical protein
VFTLWPPGHGMNTCIEYCLIVSRYSQDVRLVEIGHSAGALNAKHTDTYTYISYLYSIHISLDSAYNRELLVNFFLKSLICTDFACVDRRTLRFTEPFVSIEVE